MYSEELKLFFFFHRAKWSDPLITNLSDDGLRLITSGLPSSGPLLAFALNVFQQFNFSSKSLEDFNSTVTTYHRMIETYKYAYAMRTKLADGDFVDLSEVTLQYYKQFLFFVK